MCRWLSSSASLSQTERLNLLDRALSYEHEQERETDAPALFPCLPNGAARCQ